MFLKIIFVVITCNYWEDVLLLHVITGKRNDPKYTPRQWIK